MTRLFSSNAKDVVRTPQYTTSCEATYLSCGGCGKVVFAYRTTDILEFQKEHRGTIRQGPRRFCEENEDLVNHCYPRIVEPEVLP